MADDQERDLLELAPEAEIPEGERQSFWGKLRRGLLMTHTELIEKVSAAVEGKATLDEATLEYLEEILIGADLGVDTALEMVDRVKRHATREQVGDVGKLKKLLADEMAGLLFDLPPARRRGPGPLVTLVVGVNGVGKTTSIAKLARRAARQGERVVIAAADTFRAAAIEQLELWGRRLGVEVVRQP